MTRQRLDGDHAVFHRNAAQIVELAEIDEIGRAGQSLLHGRQQGLAAGEDFAVGMVGGELGSIGE